MKKAICRLTNGFFHLYRNSFKSIFIVDVKQMRTDL